MFSAAHGLQDSAITSGMRAILGARRLFSSDFSDDILRSGTPFEIG